MRIEEQANRWYRIEFFEIVNERDIQNNLAIDVSPGEIKTMQILVKYAMPSLLGWNGALDPKVCGLFFKMNPNE